MASKQAVTTPASKAAAAVKPARAAKPTTPRVSSAKHSKSVQSDVVVSATPVAAIPVEVNSHEAISKIAYGYWVARGYQGGCPHEDWLRAEQEFLALR
jgi:hypothetical protein